MKNTAIPNNELEVVKNAIEAVNKIVEVHEKSVPNLEDIVKDPVFRIHTLMYLDLLQELVTSAQTLEAILEMSREEFIENIESEGTSIEEFEKKVMMKAVMDIISND